MIQWSMIFHGTYVSQKLICSSLSTTQFMTYRPLFDTSKPPEVRDYLEGISDPKPTNAGRGWLRSRKKRRQLPNLKPVIFTAQSWYIMISFIKFSRSLAPFCLDHLPVIFVAVSLTCQISHHPLPAEMLIPRRSCLSPIARLGTSCCLHGNARCARAWHPTCME